MQLFSSTHHLFYHLDEVVTCFPSQRYTGPKCQICISAGFDLISSLGKKLVCFHAESYMRKLSVVNMKLDPVAT